MDKKFLYKILYYGSLWGIAEATLGHLLHAVALFDILKISGSIMFPIGVACMYRVFINTDKTSAIMLTSIVAAAIKSVNALIPGAVVFSPVIAILFEGLSVYLIMPIMLSGREKQPKISTLFVMGFTVTAAWRVPFLFVPWQLGMIGIWQKSTEVFMSFLTTAVFFNAIFITVFMLIANRLPEGNNNRFHERFAFVPVGACSLFAAAVLLEYLI